jgi:hypothetical protein
MMTLREYIEIINDIDGYIAGGGRLLDIPLHGLSSLPQAVQETFSEYVEPSALARFERFLAAAAEGISGNETLGTSLSEERARTIWSGTMLPH